MSNRRKISEKGVRFQSHIDGSYHFFTPEYAIDIQRLIGADIIMAFDVCPAGGADKIVIDNAVEQTNKWIRRCESYLENNKSIYNWNQCLFPIVQGGAYPDLRIKSVNQLISYSTCGMAIGGLAVGEEKNAMFDISLLYTSELPTKRIL